MKNLKDECAKRKAARAAGKTRVKKTPSRPWLKQLTPQQRFKPANDGTRRGVPNYLPDSYIKYPNERSQATRWYLNAVERRQEKEYREKQLSQETQITHKTRE